MQTLIVGIAGFYLTCLLRVLPMVTKHVQQGRKPWSCNVCMAFWSTLPLAVALFLVAELPIVASASVAAAAPGVALMLLLIRDALMLPPDLR